ncbi:MAG TPA: GAF domain-containing protein [Vicinamibacterales bacterium]|nr:GAF domain-containing protein [Vicinamibacterales bacterium]
MSRLSVRILLLIACLSAIGAAAFDLWSTNRRARSDAELARQFNAAARAAFAAAGELRAAQQAYVADGQGEGFWFDRVTAIHAELEQQVARLGSLSPAGGAKAALADASAALREFAEMDQRARDYTRNGERTRAAGMIFADGIALTRRVSDALAGAAVADQVARDAAAAQFQRTQVQALAGAAGVTILGLLLLVPAARRPAAAQTAAPQTASARIVLPDFDEFRPPVRPAAKVQAVPPPPPPPAPVPAVDIGIIAALCNDLARVADTRGLPALLERAASALDASGVIVWIADPDGRELAPILVHGYPPQLATRLGTIARDANNLTASAYRTGLLQAVKGDTITSGAIAVPLVGAAGCVGVMAAEVKNGGEQQEDLLAAATIVAAQLATLAGPPSARARSEAAG